MMDTISDPKSRTQIKKDARKLQIIGEKLMALTKDQLKALDIPEELKEAVMEATSIRSHQAGKRQRQYIGALMRKIDPEPVIRALSLIDAGLSVTSNVLTEKKAWARALSEGDDEPFETIVEKFPQADRQRLRQLVRNVRKAKGSPKEDKAFKHLVSYLKELG